MKNKHIYLLGFAIVILIVILLLNKMDPVVCFGDSCFDVEVVDDDLERAKGLMFRENMDEDKGMLFVFQNSGDYPFWMKNTILPLDIIWIDSDFRVVHIANNTEPQSLDIIYPSVESRYVLEINSGVAYKNGIDVGSIASIKGINLG